MRRTYQGKDKPVAIDQRDCFLYKGITGQERSTRVLFLFGVLIESCLVTAAFI